MAFYSMHSLQTNIHGSFRTGIDRVIHPCGSQPLHCTELQKILHKLPGKRSRSAVFATGEGKEMPRHRMPT